MTTRSGTSTPAAGQPSEDDSHSEPLRGEWREQAAEQLERLQTVQQMGEVHEEVEQLTVPEKPAREPAATPTKHLSGIDERREATSRAGKRCPVPLRMQGVKVNCRSIWSSTSVALPTISANSTVSRGSS